MKDYQNLVEKALIAIAIVVGAWIIGEAIQAGAADIGSQIAAALSIVN